MPFDLHAFISYAHLDNQPLEDGEKGWVSRFHATLQTRLSQRLGEHARIWRDDKLNGNDVFSDEILAQFARTALLVSILSPRYLRSEWCQRELDKFAEAALQTGGVEVGSKSRVIKVVKTPLDPGLEPPSWVQRTLGYEFYQGQGDASEEIDPVFGEQARQEFLRRVSGLAVQMASSLRALAAFHASPGTPPPPTGPAVYLAECGRDMQSAREQIATDLRVHGFEVLPSQQLASTEAELRRDVSAHLERAVMAIHIVGASAGPVPDGPTGRSLVALQNELAADAARTGRLKRLIWLPEGTRGERAEQQAYIDALLCDAALQYGADLLRGDIEALRNAMHQTLASLQAAAPPAPEAAGALPTVHLLMTEGDRTAAVPLIRALRAQQLQVTTPVFTGAAAELRQLNAQLVEASDAVLLFYGLGDEVWKLHQLNDLRKHGVAPPWLLLAPAPTPDKALLQALAEPGTIDLQQGLSDDALEPLLARLKAMPPRPH